MAVGIVAEDDDGLPHPAVGEPVQDVLEDRPAVERGEELAAAEPRSGPGRQHEGDDTSAPHARSGDRALAERDAGAAVALGDDLGEDRERRLGRGATAEVEPDRSAQPRELVRRSRPASRSRARRSACVFFEPTAPT